MSKRKISQRQAERIREIQEKRLSRAAKQADSLLAESHLGPEQNGLLITRYGKQLEVEAENGEVYQCHSRQNLYDLVVGDKVVWQPGPNHSGVIVACLPRRALLARASGKRQEIKPIAANIDQMLLVLAPEPAPTTLLIDSYLVAAEHAAIPLTIVVNKTDLLAQQTTDLLEKLNCYQALGYTVIKTCTLSGQGIAELKAALANRVNIFVGQSGVGKSSLIAQLLPEAEIAVGDLAGNTKLGAHTTSASRLYHLPSGGSIIDSPGIREFSLGILTPEEIIRGFVEFKPFLGQCRFNNCKHLQEPNCALRAAVEEGKVSGSRFENYQRLSDIS